MCGLFAVTFVACFILQKSPCYQHPRRTYLGAISCHPGVPAVPLSCFKAPLYPTKGEPAPDGSSPCHAVQSC